MASIIGITLKGIFRDRIFQGIMVLVLLFLAIPSAASLSMRQMTELSITLSLSLLSFILLLLAVFLGGTTLWKDIERRYTFSVLSLPIARHTYIIGRFAGVAFFLLLVSFVLGVLACIVIKVASLGYPPSRPLRWDIIVAAIAFEAFKNILLVAVAMLLSAFSTSFFLPVFGTVGIYLAGNVTQQVNDYLKSPVGMKDVDPLLRQLAEWIYYVIPNLSGFNLKVNAIYALPLSFGGIAFTLVYGCCYAVMLLAAASIVFSRREMK